MFGSGSIEPWAIDLVTRCRITAGSRVLDLACGTGVVTRVASDVRIEWRSGDAARLPFPDSSFDAVLCQQGFEFFEDHQRALGEIARVLRGKGRLAFSM
jgi:ubiquinone/menaquinone biosynthesis C-methylase UbiE